MLVKRLITIIVMSVFLHAGIAHALADCFGPVGRAHEPVHKLPIGESANQSNAEHDEPGSIHCADRHLQFGPMVQSSPETLSTRHAARFLCFAWLDSAAHALIEQSAAPPKGFLLASTSPQFHDPVYLVLSVLRI